MKVALYVRRSTIDLQPESLAVQEELLRAHAAGHGHDVVRVYSDSASGKYVAKRDDFQRLIRDVKTGPDFEAILVRDVSRWSRAENTDEAGFYEFICRSHGVQVIYVDETFAPDQSPYSLLMKSVKRAIAAEFSIEKARTVRFSHARVVRLGYWPLGSAPYALRRVLVDHAGNEIAALRHGDRKALSNQRVRFALGDPAQVAVVQRMFRAFAAGDSATKIAEDLNVEGIPSSQNSFWTPSMVLYDLRNPAYIGALLYSLRNGQKRSALRDLRDSVSDRIVRFENAHPAIIDRKLWKTVQQRLRDTTPFRTDLMLLEDLYTARLRWRPQTRPPKEIITGQTIRRGYGKTDDEVITPKRIKTAVEAVIGSIRAMRVTPFEEGFLLDHLLHVGIRASLPHARRGGLHWTFTFGKESLEDVVLGLCFSPPPLIEHVETILFRPSGFPHRARAVHPPVDSTRNLVRFRRFPPGVAPLEALRNAIQYRGKRAEERLIAAMQGCARVDLKVLAKQLSWPLSATRTIYRKLEIRGEPVPPAGSSRFGRRVKVTCPSCQRDRFLPPDVAFSLETDVCFICQHRLPLDPLNRVIIECPGCGRRRPVFRSRLRKMSHGAETLCRSCTTKKLPGWRHPKPDVRSTP